MRIISGKLGGRVLKVPAGLPVRPTTDRTKEALFNMLAHRFDFEGLTVLDLFCGTGNISLECFSRGAENIIAVDKDKRCVQAVKQFFKDFEVQKGQVIQADVFTFATKIETTLANAIPFDLIFLDPPYAIANQVALVQTLLNKNILAPEGWLIIEHNSVFSFEQEEKFLFVRKYGSSSLSFFGAEV
jgi:16S rRNA (guanine966-N2)-methyltransferase